MVLAPSESVWATMGQSLGLSCPLSAKTNQPWEQTRPFLKFFLLNFGSTILLASFSYPIRFEVCVSRITKATLWVGN